MTTTASPATMPKFKTPTVPAVGVEASVTDLALQVIAGEFDESLPDNVIKAKQLKKGQHVRAWLTIKGTQQPAGGTRVVDVVSPVDSDGMVEVSFSSLHPTETFKAARRFFVVQEA